jgi:excisionase family DNA binding protein
MTHPTEESRELHAEIARRNALQAAREERRRRSLWLTLACAALVLGCGPVGLACIAELRMRGIGPIVAADFSPKRRQLAEQLGADVVVDPRDTPAIDAWRRVDGSKPLVIFEAVGVPGMIEQAMRMAPKDARILVVGACMQEDRIHPMLGIGRELNIQFALAYTPAEAAELLGISRKHVYVLMERGELRTTKIGSCRRVPADEVRRLAGLEGGSDV